MLIFEFDAEIGTYCGGKWIDHCGANAGNHSQQIARFRLYIFFPLHCHSHERAVILVHPQKENYKLRAIILTNKLQLNYKGNINA